MLINLDIWGEARLDGEDGCLKGSAGTGVHDLGPLKQLGDLLQHPLQRVAGGVEGGQEGGGQRAVDVRGVGDDQHLRLRLAGSQRVEVDAGVEGGQRDVHPLPACTLSLSCRSGAICCHTGVASRIRILNSQAGPS